MYKILQLTKITLLALVAGLLLLVPSVGAQTAPVCKDAGGTTAIEACMQALEEDIQEETRDRCGEPRPGDAYADCADRVRTGYFNGDRNLNGVDDENEDESDPGAGAVLDADCKETELDKGNCGIIGYIVTFTNALAILVGIVIVIMIAVGGIQYTTARDDPQQVSAAKNRIRNAILALVFYLFTFAFLNYLVPGGVF